jgi:phage protein D
MGLVEFKMFFDGQSATSAQLDKVDEIVVEQSVDKAWEARIKIPVCVNNDGKWEGESEAWMKAFKQIRVEVNPGDGKFVPLIDGPVVGFDNARTALPGKSVVTVVVHDDSALLNREAKVEVHQGKADSDLASQIFSEAHLTPDVDKTPPQPDAKGASVRRGTPMHFLRDLARRNHDFHAYVLPGKTPGQSIGCFKRFRKDTDGLPDMTLLGADRNIETFNVKNKAQDPSTVKAATLSIAHDTIQTSTSSYRDATLMGDQAPDASDPKPATRLLPPGQTDRTDLDQATKGASAHSGFSLEATGTIVPFCYPAALSPYRVVLVKISNSQYSAKYLISQVTHTLTRSIYTQSFAMKGDSVTAGGKGSGPQPSALLNLGFNIQAGIF